MKKNVFCIVKKYMQLLIMTGFCTMAFAQQNDTPAPQNTFWSDVQFGGGLGLGFGNGFTNVAVSPSAIYNFNQYVSAGVGLQYSYLNQKNFYSSSMYGGSVLALFNPVEEIQLSAELEQLRVNLKYSGSTISDDFWNTGLFLGAGYRMDNITIGARYNVLFKEDQGVYGDAFMPFVRVFF